MASSILSVEVECCFKSLRPLLFLSSVNDFLRMLSLCAWTNPSKSSYAFTFYYSVSTLTSGPNLPILLNDSSILFSYSSDSLRLFSSSSILIVGDRRSISCFSKLAKEGLVAFIFISVELNSGFGILCLFWEGTISNSKLSPGDPERSRC